MYEYQARIVHIVDADTVDLEIDLGFDVHIKQRVRLAGIDAPERFTDEGRAATKWLMDFVGWMAPRGHSYPSVTIRSEKVLSKGKYGRYIAHVYRGRDEISKAMVDAGHAVVRDY